MIREHDNIAIQEKLDIPYGFLGVIDLRPPLQLITLFFEVCLKGLGKT